MSIFSVLTGKTELGIHLLTENTHQTKLDEDFVKTTYTNMVLRSGTKTR